MFYILFIFINDLPLALQIFSQLFADDCSLQSEGPDINLLIKKTSEELERAESWFQCNKLTLNLKKTKYVIFGRNLKSLEFIPDLTIGGIKIDRVGQSQAEQSVRFLGLWVSDAENFSPSHIQD